MENFEYIKSLAKDGLTKGVLDQINDKHFFLFNPPFCTISLLPIRGANKNIIIEK